MDASDFAPPTSSMQSEIESKKRRREPLEEYEKKTIFVLNLPMDVTERELKNMFYFWPGFLKVSLWRKEDKVNAFVLFDSSQAAVDGKERLTNYSFDAEQNSVLHTKMALKNVILSRDERNAINQERSARGQPSTDYDYQQAQWGQGYVPGMGQDASMYAYAQEQGGYAYGNYDNANVYAPYGNQSSSSSGMSRGQPRARKAANPPCNTLFLAKIDALTEEALIQFIRMSCTGYKDHKVAQDRSGQNVGFFEFTSVEHATESLSVINGHQGIQAAFARNSLNQKRF